MSDLSHYRSDIRQMLDDVSSDRYPIAIIDESLELSLLQYSRRKPLLRTYALDSTGSRRITLPADLEAMAIVDVEWVTSLADFNDRIAFYATKPNEQWELETPGNLIPLGEVLTIHYHALHTIDGFNSAAGTTVLEQDEELVQIGAAGYACIARATQLVETNNLNPMEAAELFALGRNKIETFLSGIGRVEHAFAHSTWHDKSIDKNY